MENDKRKKQLLFLAKLVEFLIIRQYSLRFRRIVV